MSMPACLAAAQMVVPSGTVTAAPSIVRLTVRLFAGAITPVAVAAALLAGAVAGALLAGAAAAGQPRGYLTN